MPISIGAKTPGGLPLPLQTSFFFAVVGLASRIRSWVSVLRGGGATALTPSWCCAVLLSRMGLKCGPQWLRCCGGRASLQMHFAECEISGGTVYEPGFSIMSFSPSSHGSLSTIWKAHWELVCLFFLVGQCGRKKGTEAESQEYGYFFICSQLDCSPMHVAGPTVHLYILHLLEEPARSPPLEQEVRSAQSVQIAVACLRYLCTPPWPPLPGESQLSCVP